MPIVAFENRHEAPLVLVIEPWGEKHEIPHLSTAGVRFVLKDGAEDRSHSVMSENQIDFWCNADSYEIDIVHPSAFDKLSWDICVNGGWCGGIVDGQPACVEDLLPETGLISARDFAKLAVRADGWPDLEPMQDKHLRWIEAKFVEHLGSPSAPVEYLRRNLARPFGETSS